MSASLLAHRSLWSLRIRTAAAPSGGPPLSEPFETAPPSRPRMMDVLKLVQASELLYSMLVLTQLRYQRDQADAVKEKES